MSLSGNPKKAAINNSHALPMNRRMIDKYLHWGLVLCGTAILAIVVTLLPDDAEAIRAPSMNASVISDDEFQSTLDIPALNSHSTDHATNAIPEEPDDWFHAEVRSGDSLSTLFNRHGLSAQELLKVTSEQVAAEPLTRLYPGEQLKLRINDATLTELIYDYDVTHTLHMVRVDDGFESAIIEKPLETRTAQSSGVIKDSLFMSAQAVGLSDRLTMELAGIFGWDIDFALDIRRGDTFAVIYEEIFLNGERCVMATSSPPHLAIVARHSPPSAIPTATVATNTTAPMATACVRRFYGHR